MKKFIKIINVRLSKSILFVATILFLQMLLTALSVAIFGKHLFDSLYNSSNSIILFSEVYKNVVEIYIGIIAFISAFFISCAMTKFNDISCYLHQGIKRSTNLYINFVSSAFSALLVALVSVVGILFGKLIFFAANKDILFLNSVGTVLFDIALFKSMAIIFLQTMATYFLCALIFRGYKCNKYATVMYVSIAAIVIFICFSGDMFGIGLSFFEFYDYIFTYYGYLIIVTSTLVIASVGYSLLELKGALRR